MVVYGRHFGNHLGVLGCVISPSTTDHCIHTRHNSFMQQVGSDKWPLALSPGPAKPGLGSV
jgi:hypothetical protein